ncbi:hypothetical protein M9H77_25865 [Catharanthus roseus]|uniref:Uncharacterized protein n=1 Tax=Catharanthus roseus TaxID=4058 RepID=A0ACC0A830_CATRO|nr:hypothetical protein M9H77_25865 [Catharanthus roseus]
MELEQHLPQGWNSLPALTAESENISACFDCSICLDFARDPVVTLCGHLYCWPCIYQWMQQSQSTSVSSNGCAQCPVCKAEISHEMVVPLYGRGRMLAENVPDNNMAASSNMIIPPRPNATSSTHYQQLSHENSHQEDNQSFLHPDSIHTEDEPLPELSNAAGSTMATVVCHPMVGMLGEMVYARVFGNSESLYVYPNSYCLAGSNNARLRRQERMANKYLNRVSIFLLCCVLYCLLLF